MTRDSTGRYSFDSDSVEHYLLLGAIITIVTGDAATDGALIVAAIDEFVIVPPRAYCTT